MGPLYHIAALGTTGKLMGKNMNEIIASVFFEILSYTIENIIFLIFKFNNYNC